MASISATRSTVVVVASVVVVLEDGGTVVDVVVVVTDVGVVAGVPPELHAAITTASTATPFSFPLIGDTIRKSAKPS